MPQDHPQKDLAIPNLGGSLDLEIARLLVLERRKIERAGGLFPERANELEGFTRVLDIMSGTGTWTLQIARIYPEIEVHGLERQKRLVAYANGQAELLRLGNASYAQLSAESPPKLNFPDNFFDLVNASYLFVILHPDEWVPFFQECLRVTRPDGYIRVSELDWGMTTSPAIEKLAELFLRGLKQANLGLSTSGRDLGILPRLPALLSQAGWSAIQQRALVDEYLSGAGMPRDAEQAIALMVNTMRDITLQQGMVTPEEYAALLTSAARELASEDFSSLIVQGITWARKPTL